jgi:ribosomal protein S18 acetylase RimI-like enzyme
MISCQIRRATGDDAEGIAALICRIAAERIHSAIDQPFSVEQERAYLTGLSPREAMHLAAATDQIAAVQSLDLWSPLLGSMNHVAQLGTFVLPEWRGKGLGHALWTVTRSFAIEAGYRKIVIQVRASNAAALGFYTSLGFRSCGRLTRQVIIDGVPDDEILMELFL